MTLEDHCRLQKEMFHRWREKGYTGIQQNVYYARRINGTTYFGEIDLLGRHPKGFYVFCEIKSSRKKYEKALSQFHRYVYSHPEVHAKGIMVSLTAAKRLYNCGKTKDLENTHLC
jgi:RecB family endonuclease NucS